QYHRELVATEPSDGVAPAQRFNGNAGDGLQQAVAFGVSELVVDLLEVIAIDIGEAESDASALMARNLGRQRLLKSLAVANGSQGVDSSRVSLLLVDLSQHAREHDHDRVFEEHIRIRD